MDRLIVQKKLESLRRCLARVRDKQPASVVELTADLDLQDVLVLNLTRAVQVCVDIGAHMATDSNLPPPDTMGETFDHLAQAGLIDTELAGRMKKAVGFRNVAVHAYEAVDWHIVYAIVTHHLDDFESFGRAVAKRIDGQPD